MAFEQKILNEINCPRCNAIAQERLEDRTEGYAIIILWCEKCRLRRNLGVTTRKALRLRKRQKRLRSLVNQTKSPLTKRRMIREIALLDEKIRRAEVI